MESKAPKTDIDKLIQRLRSEAVSRSMTSSGPNGSAGDGPDPAVPAMVAELGAKAEQLTHRIECARITTRAANIPKLFRRFLRDQGKYNSLLIESVTIFREMINDLTRIMQRHEQNLQKQLDVALEYIRHQDSHVPALEKQVEQIGQDVTRLRGQISQDVTLLSGRSDTQTGQLQNLEAAAAGLKAELANTHDLHKKFMRMDERHTADSSFLKSELHLLHRQLSALSESMPAARKKSQPEVEPPGPTLPGNDFDALYVAFENQFRGSRDLIKERLRIYLEVIGNARVEKNASPVLDLGCGRGEWLELLIENGFSAAGVDLNTIMVAECANRHLPVTHADALTHLRSVSSGSQSVVTAFHLVEHLEFPVLLSLFRESLRVLRPGGLIIFETPNPNNVLVGSNRFYTDPTHRNPLPPPLLVFLAENTGFTDAVARPLHSDDHKPIVDSAAPELSQFVNKLFFGEQDYALIAQKPANQALTNAGEP